MLLAYLPRERVYSHIPFTTGAESPFTTAVVVLYCSRCLPAASDILRSISFRQMGASIGSRPRFGAPLLTRRLPLLSVGGSR